MRQSLSSLYQVTANNNNSTSHIYNPSVQQLAWCDGIPCQGENFWIYTFVCLFDHCFWINNPSTLPTAVDEPWSKAVSPHLQQSEVCYLISTVCLSAVFRLSSTLWVVGQGYLYNRGQVTGQHEDPSGLIFQWPNILQKSKLGLDTWVNKAA